MVETTELDLVQYSLWWLRTIGLFPKAGKRSFGFKLRTAFFFTQFVLHAVLNSVKLPTCGGNLNCIIQNLTFSILFYSTVYCYFSILHNEKFYLDAIVKLESLTAKYHNEAEIMKVELLCRKIGRVAAYTCNVMILHYLGNPLLLYRSCIAKKDQDIQDITTLTCGLPSPIWLPFFDYTRKPGIIFAYLLIAFWTYPYIWVQLQSMSFILNLIAHVIVHLISIQNKLLKIREDPKERHDKLRHCIQHHIDILNLFDTVSIPLNQFLFMYATLMSIILSMLAFQMLEMLITDVREATDLITYVFVAFCWFTVLTIISFSGQALQDESEKIAEIAYDIPWYDEDVSFQKTVMQVMLRAQTPLILRTASIGSASLENFTKVMSQTYSYVTLLYNTVLSSM